MQFTIKQENYIKNFFKKNCSNEDLVVAWQNEQEKYRNEKNPQFNISGYRLYQIDNMERYKKIAKEYKDEGKTFNFISAASKEWVNQSQDVKNKYNEKAKIMSLEQKTKNMLVKKQEISKHIDNTVSKELSKMLNNKTEKLEPILNSKEIDDKLKNKLKKLNKKSEEKVEGKKLENKKKDYKEIVKQQNKSSKKVENKKLESKSSKIFADIDNILSDDD